MILILIYVTHPNVRLKDSIFARRCLQKELIRGACNSLPEKTVVSYLDKFFILINYIDMINKEAIAEIYEPLEEKLVQKILNSNRRIQRQYLNWMLGDMREKMEKIVIYQLLSIFLGACLLGETLYLIFS